MKIIGNTLHFKSNPCFYYKELSGLKKNTIRKSNIFLPNEKPKNLKIAIHNSVSGEYFVRQLTDISFYDGWYIFSW